MPAAHVFHPGATVLVVDEDVLARIAVADYLRDCGYRVIESSSGHEARTVLMRGPEIHVLFADTRLAGNDNIFALAQWVRKNRPSVKVLLNAGLLRKSEAAAHLCSHNNTSPPATHLRERIESMAARHGRGIRNAASGKPRVAYR